MKSRMIIYGSLVVLALIGGAYWYQRSERLNEVTKALTPLHLEMTPSDFFIGPTEANPGQSFMNYRLTHGAGDTGTLYIQPIGNLTDEEMNLVDETADFLSVFYSAPTQVLDPISDDLVPKSARRTNDGKEQFDASYILHDVLKPIKPDDTLAVLAITSTDLFPRDSWNFVFGLASLSEGIGVWSLHRYGEPGTDEFRQRIFKIAIHETGHMFGIKHCAAFQCLMNFANTRLQVDLAPIWFCPECVQKVAYVRGLDLSDYLNDLATFAESHELNLEAEYWSKSRDVVNAMP